MAKCDHFKILISILFYNREKQRAGMMKAFFEDFSKHYQNVIGEAPTYTFACTESTVLHASDADQKKHVDVRHDQDPIQPLLKQKHFKAFQDARLSSRHQSLSHHIIDQGSHVRYLGAYSVSHTNQSMALRDEFHNQAYSISTEDNSAVSTYQYHGQRLTHHQRLQSLSPQQLSTVLMWLEGRKTIDVHSIQIGFSEETKRSFEETKKRFEQRCQTMHAYQSMVLYGLMLFLLLWLMVVPQAAWSSVTSAPIHTVGFSGLGDHSFINDGHTGSSL